MSKQRLIIVGNGMVGYRLCEYVADSRASQLYETVCFGEEPRPAYDRVQLTSYFGDSTAKDLELADAGWYARNGIDLRTNEQIVGIDRASKQVRTATGRNYPYDKLVLATGSAPFVPPFPGTDLPGVFVYRTIEDLDAIRAYAKNCQSAAVIGGGLLGLEAAKALYDLGMEAHVVEFAPGLMMRQLDGAGSALLAQKIEALGVRLHLAKATQEIRAVGDRRRFCFADDTELDVDMVVISAGIRPRDELAAAAELKLGARGGVAVDAAMRTSDPDIFAIGECASREGMVYGLVAPGYVMADVAAAQLIGDEKSFEGADMSTKLKLMGVDVASIGDAVAEEDRDTTFVTIRDDLEGVYKKLIINRERKTLRGAVLVGDVSSYPKLLQYFRSAKPIEAPPVTLVVENGEVAAAGGAEGLDDDALVCTCNNVTKGDLCAAVAAGACALGDLKKATQAATGCGGCTPQVKLVLDAELAKSGVELTKSVCEHFPISREELYLAVKLGGRTSYAEVLRHNGNGAADGCEVCKPVVASIFASLHGKPAVEHQFIQDTNDRFLANIQRGGTYSVIPRIPGGEITPQGLITIGEVARRYDLYVKITGGQRIDLLGARVDQLPDIWEELVDAGFESGHAYAKGVRTVKSCVGSTWCRFGLLDSVAFAVRIENRYKGLRSPHKLKSAVSGCIRECAEARSKDFGIIATAEGWNLYVCGNGGANPRHAELLAAGIDDETCIAYIDRFLMFYIRTADPLTRTAPWLEALEGGIEYLREVVIEDRLGICDVLESEMGTLVQAYECEWAKVVRDPVLRARFKAFANSEGHDPTIRFARERGQRRPDSGGARQQEPSAAAQTSAVVYKEIGHA